MAKNKGCFYWQWVIPLNAERCLKYSHILRFETLKALIMILLLFISNHNNSLLTILGFVDICRKFGQNARYKNPPTVTTVSLEKVFIQNYTLIVIVGLFKETYLTKKIFNLLIRYRKLYSWKACRKADKKIMKLILQMNNFPSCVDLLLS